MSFVALLLIGVLPHALAQNCLSREESTFVRTAANVPFTWDLSGLCIEGGEYTAFTSNGETFSFNVGGSAISTCAWSAASPQYASRGAAIQYFGPVVDPDALACVDWTTGELPQQRRFLLPSVQVVFDRKDLTLTRAIRRVTAACTW